MFTIDLLKGHGVPTKSSPEGIAIIAAGIAVPVITAIVMFGCYINRGIVLSVQKQEIVNYQTKINGLAGALELQKAFEKDMGVYNSCLSEVSSAIGKHAQWSPLLVAMVENLPDSVMLTKLETKQSSVKIKVPQKDDPEKTIEISVPVRTLQISVSGSRRHNTDKAVRDFRDRLRFSSPAFAKQGLEDIRVSQKVDTVKGQDVVSYEIDCVFKPGS